MDKVIDEQCDDTCIGTKQEGADLLTAKVEEQTAIDLAEMFKALGDPTRVKMIYALLSQELCVHDLCVVLDMAQSAISHQLRYLRNVRIVKRRKVGKTVYYSLDDDHVKEIFIQTLQHLHHS
ncbi:DNA-binding transcriptional regulator, ArsR family [Paenibacillus algorifonticola]|uniref:DNA-binding transcriptional regulator, ArsR family n=1 Tax=Paenibacillus algorifonticola TaxID=684063 RepID=A0A1I1YIG8_9BACL|nr:metalloregulator ArsR/SmtB family transcription factor [Paenibacillus algorifonticola]SFE19336.1 DNA-binding transcriptional regulator, ArsR family [Paenibacillus algorifonticola]